MATDDEMRYDVIVIGDVFCDIATMPIRDYPERDKQIGCEFMLSTGGQAGNCAAACASLGLRTALICKAGNDVLSNWVLSELRTLGVRCFNTISGKGNRSGITVSIAFEDGSRSMLSDRGANIELKGDDVDFELLKEAGFVMRAGHWNTEGLFTSNKRLIEFANSASVFTGVDIGWSAYLGWTDRAKETVFEFLPFTEFLFVNEAEIKGLCADTKEGGGAHELLDRGCKNVIVHRGANGSSWICKEFELNCPSFNVKPISPTGAGDVFNAGFIYALLELKAAEDCLKFANACAALHISRRRAINVFPTVESVTKMVNKQIPVKRADMKA
ncbi:MAG: carbohydrate kinase family protein [Halobacteriota archaeon]